MLDLEPERHAAGVTGGVRVEEGVGPAALTGMQPGVVSQ